jgi:hypothetical protein
MVLTIHVDDQEGGKLVPLSTRKYLQLEYLAHLRICLSRSGKYDIITLHELQDFPRSQSWKRTKFESETRVKKVKETKGCTFFSVSVCGDSTFLSAVTPTKIVILKYAPHPLHRFLVIKEIPIEGDKPKSVHVIEGPDKSIKVCTDDTSGFRIYDLQSATIEIVSPLHVVPAQLGTPIAGVMFDKEEYLFCMCYRNMGLLQHVDQQFLKTMFTWRYPLGFSTKMSMYKESKIVKQFLVAGSQNIVDVIDIGTGKIVHVFETKRDKHRELKLLVSNEQGRVD